MRWLIGPLVLLLTLLPKGAAGQEESQIENPFGDVFFAPEFIMQHRRAINLTDEQRDAITGAIQDLQGQAVSTQFELLDEMQSLVMILEEDRIDMDRALDQLENFLDTENRVKQAQMELLVRIKNVLTPEQQRILRERRAEASERPGSGP